MKVSVKFFYPTKAHAKQKLVLDALDNGQRFVLLRAGRKFRKTSLIISWLMEKALVTGLTCPYIAPNRTQAKLIAWQDHVQRVLDGLKLAGLPFKKNESELTVTFPNGGKLQLLGVENKEALRGISNWGAVGMDEYDDWSEDIWAEIIRPNLMTHKAPVIASGTPKGYRNLYRLENIRNRNGELIWKSFHFTSYDNPDLDPKELEDLVSEYQEMGMGTYRQEILAEYEKPEGTVYEEWNMDTQYIPFTYMESLPIHISWDFGINDATSVIVFQRSPTEIRVLDYYEASDANLKHFTEWIDVLPYKKPELETGDIAGRARSFITGKSVIAEARTLGHSIRTTAIPDIPSQIRHAHRSIKKLYVNKANPNTARFVECILNYKYPKKSQTIINQSNEIPMHDEFSHGMRAMEYYFWNFMEGGVGRVSHSDPQARITGRTAHISDTGRQVSVNLDVWAGQDDNDSGLVIIRE